jgi:hypothetical protein
LRKTEVANRQRHCAGDDRYQDRIPALDPLEDVTRVLHAGTITGLSIVEQSAEMERNGVYVDLPDRVRSWIIEAGAALATPASPLFGSPGINPPSWPRLSRPSTLCFPQGRRGWPARRPAMTCRECFNMTGIYSSGGDDTPFPYRPRRHLYSETTPHLTLGPSDG